MVAPIAWFAASLSVYHVSEFTLAAIYHPKTVSRRSWLFSTPYVAFMAAGLAEFALERRFLPWLWSDAISWLGVACMLSGQSVRFLAEVTAGSNFTHMLRLRRDPAHRLIRRGIYSCARHPGYAGWLLWAVGTQLLLCNPIATPAFAAVAWRFFSRRVALEDEMLRTFFGEEFVAYRRTVPSGIPGIP